VKGRNFVVNKAFDFDQLIDQFPRTREATRHSHRTNRQILQTLSAKSQQTEKIQQTVPVESSAPETLNLLRLL